MFATKDMVKFVQPKWCSFEFQVFTSPSVGREPLQAMVSATRAFRPYLRRIFQKQTIHGWFSCVSLKWSLKNRRVQLLGRNIAGRFRASIRTHTYVAVSVSVEAVFVSSVRRLWTYRNWTKHGCLKSVKSWYFVPTKFNPGTTLTAAQIGRGMCEMCLGNKALWDQQNLLGWAQIAQCIEKRGPWYLLCL